MVDHSYIKQNIIKINSLITGKNVKVFGVCKNQPFEKIEPLIESGHLYYAENKIQEAQRRNI